MNEEERMSTVTMRQLLEAGVHFGHQTRRWNPKMKRYIFAAKNGIYIIDLQQTLLLIQEAYDYVKNLVSNDGMVLFVGTKRQIQDIVETNAIECNMPYVKNRWLGGLLTNFETISKRSRRLDEIEEMEENGVFEKLPKKEVLGIKNEYDKLMFNMGGIRKMYRVPDALFIIDPHKEEIALKEAKKLNIPIIAITDTNCDPDDIDYVIPGNDDAIRSCNLITAMINKAVRDGMDQKMQDKQAEEEMKAKKEKIEKIEVAKEEKSEKTEPVEKPESVEKPEPAEKTEPVEKAEPVEKLEADKE